MVQRGPPPFKLPTRSQTWGSAGFNLHRHALAVATAVLGSSMRQRLSSSPTPSRARVDFP